ncbi:MAG: hypothetical protein ACM3NF_05210 [Gemmatimonadota bacterium]
MLFESRSWFRRHAAVVMSFALGVAFGVFIVALAYFSDKSGVASRMVRFGAQATGHADIGEDLVWFFGGIAVGAAVASYAWWRDGRARAAGVEEENVLNRIAATPRLRVVGRRERTGRDPGK